MNATGPPESNNLAAAKAKLHQLLAALHTHAAQLPPDPPAVAAEGTPDHAHTMAAIHIVSHLVARLGDMLRAPTSERPGADALVAWIESKLDGAQDVDQVARQLAASRDERDMWEQHVERVGGEVSRTDDGQMLTHGRKRRRSSTAASRELLSPEPGPLRRRARARVVASDDDEGDGGSADRIVSIPPSTTHRPRRLSQPTNHTVQPCPLLTSLPTLAPAHTGIHTLALPTHLLTRIESRAKSIRPRYRDGRLELQSPRTFIVLSHVLVPPRTLSAAAAQAAYASLVQSAVTSKSTRAIIQHLLPAGFGVQSTGHKDLYAAMFPVLNPKTADAIEGAFIRPVYLVERTADRGTRPDLWHALKLAVASDSEQARVSATGVELGLAIGVECEGLEEPSEGSRVPKRDERRYVLRERVVLIASTGRRVRVPVDSGDSGEDEDEDEEQTHPDVESDADADADAITRAATDLPAFPPALLGSLTTNRERRGLRYLDGTLHLATIGNTTAFATTILANQLIPPRDLSLQLLATYTHHIQPYFLPTTSLAYQLFAFALARGPTHPFTHLDAVAAMPQQVHKPAMYTALKKAVIRPVFVARELGKRTGNERVWDELSARMGGFVPEGARLVVLLGMEIVGLEDPRAADRVPKPAERVYVVRERYALVV